MNHLVYWGLRSYKSVVEMFCIVYNAETICQMPSATSPVLITLVLHSCSLQPPPPPKARTGLESQVATVDVLDMLRRRDYGLLLWWNWKFGQQIRLNGLDQKSDGCTYSCPADGVDSRLCS